MKMAKETYDFESKSRARGKLRKFIKQYLGYGNKGIKVVCFPGEEALEIFEVYDKLGIPRGNIWGVERNRRVYQQLQSRNLGINLFYGTDMDFFSQARQRFGVVSLDYQGTLNEEGLGAVVERQGLAERAVLFTNFFGARENREVQTTYNLQEFARCLHEKRLVEDRKMGHGKGNVIRTMRAINKIAPIPKEQRQRWERYAALLFDYAEHIDVPVVREGIEEVRGDGITQTIIATLILGKDPYQVNEVFKRNPLYNDVNRMIVEWIKKQEGECRIAKEDLAKTSIGRLAHTAVLRPYLMDLLHAPNFERIVVATHSFGYFVEALERYTYKGDAGKPMMADMFFVNQFREMVGKYADVVDSLFRFRPAISGLDLMDMAQSPRPMEEEVEDGVRLARSWRLATGMRFPPRKFLGSSYKPRADNEAVAKMLVGGASDGEVHQRFRIKKMGLAGIKAAITKGQYEHLRQVQTPEPTQIPVEREARNLERGVLFFDSDSERLRKNMERTGHGRVKVDGVAVLHGNEAAPGLVLRKKPYDLYVLNAYDAQVEAALAELALKFGESSQPLNLLVLGSEDSLQGEIETARGLGVKLRVDRYVTSNSHIDPNSPLRLEEVLV